ncbi:MAG: tetratricopeptide repeat protein [Planctomycetota bacterium]
MPLSRCSSLNQSSAATHAHRPWMLAWIGSTCLFFTCPGCSNSAPQTTQATPENSAARQVDECRSRLTNAVTRVSPESMALQQRRDGIVNAVNSWLASCAEADVRKLAISDANAALLTPDALRTARVSRFSETDITYIRECLMLSRLTASIWKQIDTSSDAVAADRQRVTAFFRHIIRNLALLPADSGRPPVGLYEALLTGRGSVDDRIRAFTEGLRQRQIDSLVLHAAPQEDATSSTTSIPATAEWLVLAVVGDDTLLFDPLRGTPVPSPDDPAMPVRSPAGIGVLQDLNRWKNATVFAPMHPSAPAPRMLVLQQQMEASTAAILYEELAGGTSEIRPFLDRLPASVLQLWPAAEIQLWPLPEARIAAAAIATEQQKQDLQLLMRPFDSPFERASIDREKLLADANVEESQLSQEELDALIANALAEMLQRSDTLFGKPSRRLLKARVSQLSGNFDVGMIQELQQIRIASLQDSIDLSFNDGQQTLTRRIPLPEAIVSIQKTAVADALYWTALTQVARRDYGTAVQTFRNFRRQYPDSPLQHAALLNEAESLAELGNPALAAEVLASEAPDNPEQLRFNWWRTALKAAPAGAAAADPVAPAASPSATPPTEQPKAP